jgi:hypothetical protein
VACAIAGNLLMMTARGNALRLRRSVAEALQCAPAGMRQCKSGRGGGPETGERWNAVPSKGDFMDLSPVFLFCNFWFAQIKYHREHKCNHNFKMYSSFQFL